VEKNGIHHARNNNTQTEITTLDKKIKIQSPYANH